MITEKLITRALVGLVLAGALVCLIAPSAVAWEVAGNNGAVITIERSAEDTGAATFTYWRYAGTPTSFQYANGSFCTTSPSTAFWYGQSPVATVLMPANCSKISYDALGTYTHMVINTGTDERWVITRGLPTGVYIAKSLTDPSAATTLPMELPAASVSALTGTQTVTVSNPTTSALVSMDGTLPVTVDGVGSVDAAGLTSLFVALALVAGVLLFRGVRGA